MRLRKVKQAFERLEDHHRVRQHPERFKGQWRKHFGNNSPVYIEIGMGKGKFIIEHAINHPEVNYIGLEKFTSVLIRAIDNIEQQEHPLSNLEVIRFDAQHLTDIFELGEVDKIYLNFSDPWPKERHAKRRLTHEDFLMQYKKVLKSQGELIFKTDNVALFDFTMDTFKKLNMEIIAETRDLHHSPYLEGNVMTEYEKKFSSLGMPIHMVTARFRSKH